LLCHYDALVAFGDIEMREHPDYLRQDYERTEIPQDSFFHVTEKQLNYIEILRNDLGLSMQARNAHITSIVGKRWEISIIPGFAPDVWALSRSEASQVIGKFKQWKEEKR
jgi:hypothetical protein